MIEFVNVSKRYGKRSALRGVSFIVPAGEVTLLLGANGAGKSTLLRCLLGVTDFEGTVRVAGLDPLERGREVRARIGYMPQSGGLHPDLTVRATIAFYAGLRQVPVERGEQLVEQAGLGSEMDARVGDLSGGMRQRLGFALALLPDPEILVLDEPSASLDVASRAWLAERLRLAASEGRAVLVSTHAGQELLSAGHRRIVLEEGRVVENGGPALASRAGEVRPARRGSLAPLIRKELADAIGSRWLIAYAVLLGALGLAATGAGGDGASGMALQTFGRTTATLMNLCLLLAPLVGVLMGAASIAGERERGTLEHLLAQPITRTGLLLGKHAALLVALTLATLAGFLPAGLLVAAADGPAVLGYYMIFPLIAALGSAALAGVGLFISVRSRSAVQSQGAAIFAWFGFVLLYDLVLMGSLAAGSLPAPAIAASLVLNPIDAARVLGILALEPDLYLLGPAGAFLMTRLSTSGAALLLGGALGIWTCAPVALAIAGFRVRRGGALLTLRRRLFPASATERRRSLSSPKEVTFS
jgi:ABC-2 type transport system ATP-binding protein